MKNALITGASRGLGLALARQLAQKGWGLVIDGRGKKALEEIRQELSAKTKVIAIPGDVTAGSHRKKLAKAASELGGLGRACQQRQFPWSQPTTSICWIIHWMCWSKSIAPMSLRRWRLIQALHSTLKLDACVINVTSDAGVEAYGGWGGYGSSKAALEHLSHILAEENPVLASLLG